MRELKFRAWEKVEKKMLFDADPFAIHVSGSNEPLLAETHKNENCIFEQYIGLKDKNGKEIYEGDILADKDYVGKVWTCVVEYENNFAQFYCTTTYGECWTFEDAKGDELEVIGNIHENHELLEEQE